MIRTDMRLLFVSNEVRRHRLISISYISLLPCQAKVASVGGRYFNDAYTVEVSHLGPDSSRHSR
jgi:hypothetical protein